MNFNIGPLAYNVHCNGLIVTLNHLCEIFSIIVVILSGFMV